MAFNEDSRVKIPAILHLTRLGYEYIPKYKHTEVNPNNIFVDIFKNSIKKITAHHDSFSITVPDDSLDRFEGYVMENSKNLLGKDLTITYWRFGKIRQTFTGIIGKIRNKKDEGGGYGDLHITGFAPSILLESGKDCQSFEEKTLEQIIKEVTEDYPQEAKVKVELPNTKHSLPYTVQYKESDYQFLRILKNGQKYYHHSTDEYTLY